MTVDIGTMLLHEDRSIEVALRSRVVEHEGFLNFGQPIVTPAKDAFGKPAAVTLSDNEMPMPVFGRRELSTRFRVPDGYTVLREAS